VFPVAGCAAGYATAHHDYPAADVFAGRGCLFVSPVAGRVDEVNRVDHWRSSTNRGADRGGLMVSVVGRDGVRYYGAHLEDVLDRVRPGLRVRAGTPLGRIGDTGSARGVGTHLHFGLSWPTPAGYWWVRRGAVAPATYLDAWRSGRRGADASPVAAVRRAREAYGNDTRCHAYC
jgi:murein DD-endopeptidase MepM/ murein hydrolase activator NlpD